MIPKGTPIQEKGATWDSTGQAQSRGVGSGMHICVGPAPTTHFPTLSFPRSSPASAFETVNAPINPSSPTPSTKKPEALASGPLLFSGPSRLQSGLGKRRGGRGTRDPGGGRGSTWRRLDAARVVQTRAQPRATPRQQLAGESRPVQGHHKLNRGGGFMS